jgi:hypothetical protein
MPTAYSCTLLLKRIRLRLACHPLFDQYAETLFELVSRGQDYRNAPEWAELQQRLQALEAEL